MCCGCQSPVPGVQGKATDPKAVHEIRAAVDDGTECCVRLLNYRKDGTPFWNMLSLAPMSDVDGAICFYIGVQVDVTAESAAPTTDGLPQVRLLPRAARAPREGGCEAVSRLPFASTAHVEVASPFISV